MLRDMTRTFDKFWFLFPGLTFYCKNGIDQTSSQLSQFLIIGKVFSTPTKTVVLNRTVPDGFFHSSLKLFCCLNGVQTQRTSSGLEASSVSVL